MQDKLKKIKETLEKSIEDATKKDVYIGQAIGLLDSLIERVVNGETNSNMPIPDMVWKHTDKPNAKTMMGAVERHKQIHEELSKDSITQKNTHFEQLK
tara:strand:- start:790 stop:1083 length:294 start_codon:yes stop_codon:yes gene_type:complete